ncbi:hypothetical protein FisN_22Lh063 [Fistulifera solaris]|uniref:Uncharacterized protein n=1 Tax=Fistulifera solaris TaxID=1519565 RepID=A0A1Z5JCA7_FISSO|nr:hypothetical protein FisN_22Lh063 [Fistulifera solaris]|eukprot:GAX11391.1 hypothetical protein FisN_22Lh063 [Fistulifera solaris]
MTTRRKHARFRSRCWNALVLVGISWQGFLIIWMTNHQSNKKNQKAHFILQQQQQQQSYLQHPKKREISSPWNNRPSTESSSYWWNATYQLPPPERLVALQKNNSSYSLFNGTVPSWLTFYVEWHHEQRIKLYYNETMDDCRFLVLTCRRDTVCGGVSDRLKSVPLLLQLAALYDRIFYIHWERPAPLEYYLQPGAVLDWRVPEEFRRTMMMTTTTPHEPVYRTVNDLLTGLRDPHASIVQVTLQDQHGGSSWYNRIENYRQQGYTRDEIRSLLLLSSSSSSSSSSPHSNLPRHFRHHFRSIWSTLFVPSPFLAQAIQERQTVWGLTDKTPYVAAHVRALYRPVKTTNHEAWVMHVWHCARALRPQTPVVLLSDSVDVLQAALVYTHSHPDTMMRVAPPATVVHLDQTEPRPVQEYIDTFVDLYIMAQAQCITHGRGGYGRLGVLLSQNASCFFNYYQGGRTMSCDA